MRVDAFEEYGLAELEALQRDHPEFGRVEIVNGSLVAGGVDMTGDRHRSVVQALFLLLIEGCPAGRLVRIDTYWFGDGFRLRPDLAVWNAADRPADGGAFRAPPLAVIEVLSGDAEHDLVTKRAIYDANEVATVYVDPDRRSGWWLRTPDGIEHDGDLVELELPGGFAIDVERSVLDG